ncbi:ricin-type beta-trefoil lectin domain protein [Actinoallomurus soli]|uniref:ricin-type beta-trefoil lectin domain protein n=1 Tax=Actinoallomurus soli TaxID=2952535 RepID=UPI002091FBD7|nr:ricin-type beta-trefoil lectin domain protein [Actinoallomurus soli]MCO5968231.1 ricin-type beta-trefoil lectin domain protein [Actinoallomurus soli]
MISFKRASVGSLTRKLAAALCAIGAIAGLSVQGAGTANASVTYMRNLNYCATPQGDGTANGTVITVWSCTGAPSQVWTDLGDGRIYNPHSGKCLTAKGDAYATPGTVLTLWTCATSAASQTYSIYVNNITSVGGLMITNRGDSFALGTYLTLWNANYPPAPSQEWSIY